VSGEARLRALDSRFRGNDGEGEAGMIVKKGGNEGGGSEAEGREWE
jgi:hypothetical protein